MAKYEMEELNSVINDLSDGLENINIATNIYVTAVRNLNLQKLKDFFRLTGNVRSSRLREVLNQFLTSQNVNLLEDAVYREGNDVFVVVEYLMDVIGIKVPDDFSPLFESAIECCDDLKVVAKLYGPLLDKQFNRNITSTLTRLLQREFGNVLKLDEKWFSILFRNENKSLYKTKILSEDFEAPLDANAINRIIELFGIEQFLGKKGFVESVIEYGSLDDVKHLINKIPSEIYNSDLMPAVFNKDPLVTKEIIQHIKRKTPKYGRENIDFLTKHFETFLEINFENFETLITSYPGLADELEQHLGFIDQFSNIKVLQYVLNLLEKEIGRNNTEDRIDRWISDNDEDLLTTLVRSDKDVSTDVLNELIEKYNLNCDQYSESTKKSALSYAIEYQRMDLILSLVEKMGCKNSETVSVEYFRRDLSKLEPLLDSISLRTQKDRTDWFRALTTPNEDYSRNGYRTKIEGFIRREPKSFSREYCHQLMRHIACQLYFRWNEIAKGKLEEVQVMYVTNRCRHSCQYGLVFIACNAIDLENQKLIEQDFLSNSIRNVLVKEYKHRLNIEGQTKSIRFSKKLRKRIWWQTEKDYEFINDKEFLKLGDILRCDTRDTYLLGTTEYKRNCIHLVIPPKFADNARHAEEYLCDIADHLRKKLKTFEFYIYGKKRPCMGCSGRMKWSEIEYYNEHPGFAWKHTVQHQDPGAARNTLKLISTKLPHVTMVRSANVKDYDTASDTE